MSKEKKKAPGKQKVDFISGDRSGKAIKVYLVRNYYNRLMKCMKTDGERSLQPYAKNLLLDGIKLKERDLGIEPWVEETTLNPAQSSESLAGQEGEKEKQA